MKVPLESLMVDPGPNVDYSPEFRNVLEDHMGYLRSHPDTIPLTITPDDAYRFEFDLWGVLQKSNVPSNLHWVIMRMNNYTSPTEFAHTDTVLLVPNPDVIDMIRQTHLTTHRVS